MSQIQFNFQCLFMDTNVFFVSYRCKALRLPQFRAVLLALFCIITYTMHPLLVKKNIFQAQRVFLYAEMLLHLVAPPTAFS